MIKKILFLALFAGVLINQVACLEPTCNRNCDKDFKVKAESKIVDGSKIEVCLYITPKEPLYKDQGDDYLKSHYGTFKPIVIFGKNTFIDIQKHWIIAYEMYWDGTYDASLTNYIYRHGCRVNGKMDCKKSDGTNNVIHYCSKFKPNSTPTSSVEGAKTFAFYHAEQKIDRKFFVNTWHYDITQTPPKQVSRSDYYKLQWVKDLIAAGK